MASELLTRREFALRRNVSAPRVTYWIQRGKIYGEALVGTGRKAKIREDIAVAQLARTLDHSRNFGGGLKTKLTIDPPPADRPGHGTSPAPLPAPQSDDAALFAEIGDLQEAIRREQLDALKRRNRREAFDEAVRAERYVDADAMRREVGQVATQMLTAFEGSLADLASAVAAKFALAHRDVLHEMRRAWQSIRARQSAEASERYARLPERAQAELEIEPAEAA